MKKILLLSAFLYAIFSFGQKTIFSLGLNGVGVFPMGNNYLKDGVKNFAGPGITFQTVFTNHMGFGVELSRSFTEVKDKSIYGELESPSLTNLSTYYIYKYPFTNSFSVEGQIGVGIMTLTSQSNNWSNNYKENATAFLLGTELSYKFPKLKKLEIYASPKIYFYNSSVKFEDKELDRYYSRAPLLNINIGIRLNLNEKD